MKQKMLGEKTAIPFATGSAICLRGKKKISTLRMSPSVEIGADRAPAWNSLEIVTHF